MLNKCYVLGLLLLMTLAQNVGAQIQVTLIPPSLAHVSVEDLVNFQTIHMGEESLDVYAQINLRSRFNNNVAELKTQPFKLHKGLMVYTIADVQLAHVRFYNRDIETYVRNNGFLPATDYNYCITILCSSRECSNSPYFQETNPSKTNCHSLTTLVPSPLLLSIPQNRSKIENIRPDFTWIPPMPIGSDPEINYSFKLVKIKKRQSAMSALRRNPSLYEIAGLNFVNLPFPSELADLEVGERYAWQVTALLGSTKVQESEVWEFEIIKEEQIVSMPFVRLQTVDENSYNAVNELKFIYTENSGPGDISFNMINDRGVPIKTEGKINVVSGENKISLDLSVFSLVVGHAYTILITGSDGAKYPLRFTYYKEK